MQLELYCSSKVAKEILLNAVISDSTSYLPASSLLLLSTTYQTSLTSLPLLI